MSSSHNNSPTEILRSMALSIQPSYLCSSLLLETSGSGSQRSLTPINQYPFLRSSSAPRLSNSPYSHFNSSNMTSILSANHSVKLLNNESSAAEKSASVADCGTAENDVLLDKMEKSETATATATATVTVTEEKTTAIEELEKTNEKEESPSKLQQSESDKKLSETKLFWENWAFLSTINQTRRPLNKITQRESNTRSTPSVASTADSGSQVQEDDTESDMFSKLYPDTAPSELWRDEIEKWAKKAHPAVFKNIKKISAVKEDKPDLGTFKNLKRSRTEETNDEYKYSPSSKRQALGTSSQPRRNSWAATDVKSLLKDGISAGGEGQNTVVKDVHFAATPPSSPSTGQLHVHYSPDTNYTYYIPYKAKINRSTKHAEAGPTHSSTKSSTSPKMKTPKSPKSPKCPKSPSGRKCASCGSDQSPCWRPSWSPAAGQLCNSCGLRYKKTGARCLNENCLKIPAKGEWSLMNSRGNVKIRDDHYGLVCLHCGSEVEVHARKQ